MKKTALIITSLFIAICATFSQAQSVIELDKQQFLDKVWNYETNPDTWVYNGSLPCVIDFNAKWCGPCRKMEPILKDMARKYDGKIIIYKVDVDKEKELASLFGISSIPAFLFCPTNGEPRGTMGAYPADDFEKIIRTVLLGEEAE
ncbi:MAG: thioredoxin fold domain-containing protein [Bacteroidaceae bacterium]|nr:thioredoxin fold domain-containing protein [Bacteroidaceae bacterium]